MSEKILATFRIAPDEWEQFKSIASAENVSATTLINSFIRWYIQGNRIETNSSNRIDAVEEKIYKDIYAHIDGIEEKIYNDIYNKIYEQVNQRLQVIEGKLIA